MTVYDYSFEHPDPATLLDHGAVGVMRYLCPKRSTPKKDAKRLKRPELDALHAAGLPVGIIWQDGGDSGSWDGEAANRAADLLGFPEFVPLYYAEEGLTPLDVLAARLDALPGPRPKRLYDGAPRIQTMIDRGHATGGWIASALSHSKSPGDKKNPNVDQAIARAPGAHLMQLVPKDVKGTDSNRVLRSDWGGWHPDQTFATEPGQPFEEHDMTPTEHALLIDLHSALKELQRPTLAGVQDITKQVAQLDARLAALEAKIAADQ